MDSPLCACMRGDIENAEYYFDKCRLYDEYRLELYREEAQYSEVTLNVLLKGKETLSVEINIDIFKTVKKFILSTKVFKCYDFRVLFPPLPPHRVSRATVLSFFPLFFLPCYIIIVYCLVCLFFFFFVFFFFLFFFLFVFLLLFFFFFCCCCCFVLFFFLSFYLWYIHFFST